MTVYLQLKHALLVLILTGAVFSVSPASAAILYESGTLGPTGIPWSDLISQVVPGTNVKDSVFPGVRFELSQPVLTSQIGGHFVASSNGTFFGAIVELDDENDFPDSNDLSTPDVLGTTLLTFPVLSDEVFGNLVLPLDPGWYALVFGSELFGATTNGGAVRNGTDIGDPAYISKSTSSGWITLSDPFFDNHRFVINGSVVPEPSAAVLFLLAFLPFVLSRKHY